MSSFAIRIYTLTTTVLAVLLFSAQLAAAPVESGHTAAWYNPSRNGEGWMLEVLPDDRAVAYWFTYDEEGNQRWLFGSGQIVETSHGSQIDIADLYIASGARFGDAFDPDDVVLEDVGTASFTFENCSSGHVEVDALGYTDRVPLRRITRVMGAGCSPLNGVPGEPILESAGESGSWYNPARSGEGFPLQWLADGRMLVFWFTYDEQGNQAWMTGVGEPGEGETIEFQTVYKPEGARFGIDFDPADVELIPWGEFSIELGCDAGSVSYKSGLEVFGTGVSEVSRLTRIAQPSCPYQKPGLTDLYELSWQELPIGTNELGLGKNVQARAVSDQGQVAALDINEAKADILLWQPDSDSWSTLDGLKASLATLLISSNGEEVIANRSPDNSGATYIPFRPFMWREMTGWEELGPNTFDSGAASAASGSRQIVVGIGDESFDSGQFPWIWRSDTGVVELPETEELAFTTPFGVSNDGRIVVGENRFIIEGTETLSASAVRWVDGGEPEQLYDGTGELLASVRMCNEDCSILAGVGQANFAFEHPNRGESWLWIDGKTTYLEGIEAESSDIIVGNFEPKGMSADGSMMVGSFLVEIFPGAGIGAPFPFVWTQRTGYVSLVPLLEELLMEVFPWEEVDAVSISSSGNRILLVGETGTPFVDKRRYAAVLTLTPLTD